MGAVVLGCVGGSDLRHLPATALVLSALVFEGVYERRVIYQIPNTERMASG